MDALLQAHTQLETSSNLSKAVASVQQLIDQLQSTRDTIASNPDMTALHVAKLKTPIKQSFDRIEEDLKDVNKGLNQYQKALKDKFKNSSLPSAGVGESGLLAKETGLVNRAIGMHLLREGLFEVAGTFVGEVNAAASHGEEMEGVEVADSQTWVRDFAGAETMDGDDDDEDGEDDQEDVEDGEIDEDGADTSLGRGQLQRRFANMYRILDALRTHHNLHPAIAWARQHSLALEAHGSNLEFELSRLKFVELYLDVPPNSTSSPTAAFSGPVRALEYARATFPTFHARYSREISTLLGSLAFSPDLADSPYRALFHNASAWTDLTTTFTKDFCTLLRLPPTSPLYTAVTAGSIALPVLHKVERIMSQTHGQWSSVDELPVETPLPPGYMFHSVFVCPVSKEQGTDTNWPVMLPCGHVIARESLEAHARGKQRVKCPYCPGECGVREGKRVYI